MSQYDYLTQKLLANDIEALLAKIGNVAEGRALDLGAGTSPYARLMESRGYKVTTVDLDASISPTHVSDVASTGFSNDAFDLVLCTQVLEHVVNPGAVIKEISRVLRPGGFLIASVPHVWFYHPHPSDFWRFTPEGVVQVSRLGGLELIELRAQGGPIVSFFQIMNFLLYGVLGRVGAPVYALLNFSAILSDRWIRNGLFSHNYAWLARK